ncbi:MAG: helix-turn-helix transcriptional regulator [Spirochaetes bacterium]|nr:helix-turn-helix transcriptional regulator [Spirochaetota bacterium]
MRRLYRYFANEHAGAVNACAVSSLGHFKRENFFRLAEGRDAWLVIYFETPVTVLLRGGRKKISAHSVLVFPPGTPLYYGHERGFRQYWIFIRGKKIAHWMKRHAVPVETPVACRSAAFFAEALHRIDEELTSRDTPHPVLLQNMIENLLIEIARLSEPETIRAVDQRLLAARRFIETHFPEPLRLKDIAAVAGFSPFRFSRAFHAAFGAAPVEMLIRVRLGAAREKLLTTTNRIGDIAFDVGFRDPGYFSKLFMRHVGQSPQDFRRSKKVPSRA